MANKDALLQHFQHTPQAQNGIQVKEARDGKVLAYEWENCEPIIEAAKRLSEETPGRDMRHAAFIPKYVMNKAFREGWANDPKAWKRWANNPDNKVFRTWPGKL